MLESFRSSYANAGLISELLTIDSGKYVVRVLVVIDGATRSSGMAAADTLEVAEDRARERALAGLAMSKPPQTIATGRPLQSSPVRETSVEISRGVSGGKVAPSGVTPPTTRAYSSELESPVFSAPLVNPRDSGVGLAAGGSSKSWDLDESFAGTVIEKGSRGDRAVAPTGIADAETEGEAMFAPLEVPFGMDGESLRQPTVPTEPADNSDLLAETDVEVKRLGWSNEQGRQFLKERYQKASRRLLNEVELLDFYSYLKSQPTPN